MRIWELFVIAVGLSMDAFAASICKGLSVNRVHMGHALTAGAYFGGFQALMPLIGYLLGKQFSSFITEIDHWIAFVLLVIIGVNMIRESRSKEEESSDASFSPRSMLPLAVATSIDALAVGVTFAFLQVSRRELHRCDYLRAVRRRREAGRCVRHEI
jgi:putative Mn2+ efflux pump MntP